MGSSGKGKDRNAGRTARINLLAESNVFVFITSIESYYSIRLG